VGKKGIALSFIDGREEYKINRLIRETKNNIVKGELPSFQTVFLKKQERLITELEGIMSTKDTSFYANTSKKLAEEFGDAKIIAALLYQINGSEIQEKVDLPIMDMTKVLVKTILDEIPPIKKVGILATTGSMIAGIYQNYFNSVDVEAIVPSMDDQENLVMRAIYGTSGIKAGKKILPRNLLLKAAKKLIEQGAEAIILGCTEIPLVVKQKDLDVKTFDPMELTAKEIITYIENEEEKMVTVKYHLERPKIGELILK
jgi:aspartate racemase